MAVEDWDEVCSALGSWEAAHLTTDDPAAARKQHRAWVSKLISWGQLLRQITEHPEYSDRTVASRIEARLRHLEDKLALWHRDMTPEKKTASSARPSLESRIGKTAGRFGGSGQRPSRAV